MPTTTGSGGYADPNLCLADDTKLTDMANNANTDPADIIAIRDALCETTPTPPTNDTSSTDNTDDWDWSDDSDSDDYDSRDDDYDDDSDD